MRYVVTITHKVHVEADNDLEATAKALAQHLETHEADIFVEELGP